MCLKGNFMKLEQSVVKKIKMSKMLYDLGDECFKSKHNLEKIVAGIIAANTILVYRTPTYSAIINAAAPIIGGVNDPPAEAIAPTAPATCF